MYMPSGEIANKHGFCRLTSVGYWTSIKKYIVFHWVPLDPFEIKSQRP